MKILKNSIIIALLLAGSFAGFVYFSTYHPADVETETVYNQPGAPMLQSGQQVKILSWNVQFMAGNKNNDFFFEGGEDPWPEKATIDYITTEVARVLIEEDADLILLQEVDDGSKRTYYEDQLEKLLDLLPEDYVSHTSAFYWYATFVPHPAILGAIGMKISVISKYKIDQAFRHSLSPITSDNIVIRQFSPKRCILETRLPVTDGRVFYALNTHLSAFAQGSNTMEIQVSQVDDLLSVIDATGGSGFIAGDFNLIPPGEAIKRLDEKGQKYFNPKKSEIIPLLKTYHMVPSHEHLFGIHYKDWYTNMACYLDEKVPDKTIDYLFFVGGIDADTSYVRNFDTIDISDHFPLISYVTLPEVEE